ncbi:MAG: 4-(cytidine 5'-diphospho)-2-C-methyl-D-erythritol kinase, partial [Akkermansiaceae bacterium]|nr:4-(cytidine 5'-diphospho)-2-C-methyl-D-erythritol kinase [Akkermansiaceae bacterium]
MRVRFRAPAKLNLGLRVVGRRPDGYHLLESLFVPLEYADRIELEIDAGDDIRLHVSGEDAVPRGADNLVTRAAGAYLKALGAPRHIEIRLEKEIPTAAGLGGGSSDAGRVLAKLAELLPGVPGDEVR